MKSRWTDFLTSDGEKEWRNRDLEFESVIKTKDELLTKWNDGWKCLFEALNSVNNQNFDTKIYIRSQEHSVLEALNRQYAHYSYHIEQIVYVGWLIKGSDWKNLSLGKGKSLNFNKEKFSKGRHCGHFSDDFSRE